MKNLFIVILFIVVIVFIFIRAASAQSVEDIINKYIAARGGIDRLNSINSISFTGVRKTMDNEIPIKITKVQGKLFRADFQFGGNAGYTIITPGKGWNYSSLHQSKPESIPAESIKLMQDDLDITNPLVNYYSKGYKATSLGKEIIYDKECYKIRLTSSEGKETIYFIDTQTNLLVQIRQKSETIGKTYRNPTEKITSFRDYKESGGVLFPQTIETETIGMSADLTIFNTIEVNVPVDEKLYLPDR